jgi:hypothetical protein
MIATEFKDVHIPVQQQHPGLLDPAYHYIAWIAWPHPSQARERDRLVTALLAAQCKSAGKHFCWDPPPGAGRPNLPSTLNSQHPPRTFQKLRQKDIPAAVSMALSRIHERRVPALRMLVQRWIRAGLIEPQGLTLAQRERLRELSATNALLDPDGDLLGIGRPFIREAAAENPQWQADNIKHRVWQDSQPALAMIAALKFLPPLRPPPLSVLALLEDASWVADAVWDARWLALVIERTTNPPHLLVPRRVEVRGKSRVLQGRTRAWAELMLPSKRVASAPKIGPAATPQAQSK